MLCPITWTCWLGKARSICSPRLLARASTPAIEGTRVTNTRFPAASSASGIPRKYAVRTRRPRATLLNPNRPWASTIGAASRGRSDEETCIRDTVPVPGLVRFLAPGATHARGASRFAPRRGIRPSHPLLCKMDHESRTPPGREARANGPVATIARPGQGPKPTLTARFPRSSGGKARRNDRRQHQGRNRPRSARARRAPVFVPGRDYAKDREACSTIPRPFRS